MENEQLKVSTKTRGLNFIEMCLPCSICTAQVNDAGGDWRNRRETAVSLLVWDQSLEAGGGALQLASSAR